MTVTARNSPRVRAHRDHEHRTLRDPVAGAGQLRGVAELAGFQPMKYGKVAVNVGSDPASISR